MSKQIESSISFPYQAIVNDKVAQVATQYINLGKDELLYLQKKAEEGHYTWKIGGFVSGILMILFGLSSFLSHLFGLAPLYAVLDIYIVLAGVVAIILEYREKVLTTKYINILRREALILLRPYGRASFYFLVGLLILSQGGLLGTLFGLFIVGVGIVVFYSSWYAYQHLSETKSKLHDEKAVIEAFNRFDKDKSGSLDTTELSALCISLGITLSKNELEAALIVLDKDADGKIDLNEFISWWKDKEEYV